MSDLATDGVLRNFGHELRCERVEGFGILPVREAVAFEGAGGAGQIHGALCPREFKRTIPQRGKEHLAKHRVRRDRGMIRSNQKAVAQKAGFQFVTALTKPQIQKLLADKVLQLELFEEQVHEVLGEDGRRFVWRRNPLRQHELQRAREQKQQTLEAALQKANTYLDEHPRAKLPTQRRRLTAQLQRLKLQDWLKLSVKKQGLVLTRDEPALQAAAQLDGCYVVETDLKAPQADAQTIHDRYKDLAFVVRDFRTLKSGHLEFRPWFVCTQNNTQAHALTSMLALKMRRHLERAWWSLEVTVEEGLRELENLCEMDLVHPQSGKVVARQVPDPSPRQRQLLEALKLRLGLCVHSVPIRTSPLPLILYWVGLYGTGWYRLVGEIGAGGPATLP